MFGRSKVKAGLNFIAPGTRLTGETAFVGETLIGGEIYGKVSSQEALTIEAGGLIDGELRCKELKVSGLFKGKLSCDKLTITANGTVEGEVASKTMEIIEGGQFIGVRVKDDVLLLESQDHQQPESAQVEKPLKSIA